MDLSLDIFNASPRQVEDEQIDDELPHLEPGSPAPAPPENPPQDIPPRHSTRVRSIPTRLLDYYCYTTLATLHEPQTYRKPSTDPLWQIAMKEELDALTITILGIWSLSLLDSLWLVVSGSIRSRLALMGLLSATRLVLLQKVLHRSMGLIMKRPSLQLLVSHLFVSS